MAALAGKLSVMSGAADLVAGSPAMPDDEVISRAARR
jgi:hypothetical protein